MYYYGYIKNDNFAFLTEGDERITKDFVGITENEHQQLLADNSIGKIIVLYEGRVFSAPNGQYIQQGNKFVLNQNYEQEQIEKRRNQFYNDFFETSLGYIRRKVSMKTGEIKDFLTDLLPVISMAVSQQQQVNIITYREPDNWLQDVINWEELQTIKTATPQFIQECFNQVSIDFSGVQ